MNKEQYLRYVIILIVALGVIFFNRKGDKKTPEEVQPSGYIQDNRTFNHEKHLRYL